MTFLNLGGDAVLVAPAVPQPGWGPPMAAHAHLAAWLRQAPSGQPTALWRAVARAALARAATLPDQPLWLSTSGAGVRDSARAAARPMLSRSRG